MNPLSVGEHGSGALLRRPVAETAEPPVVDDDLGPRPDGLDLVFADDPHLVGQLVGFGNDLRAAAPRCPETYDLTLHSSQLLVSRRGEADRLPPTDELVGPSRGVAAGTLLVERQGQVLGLHHLRRLLEQLDLEAEGDGLVPPMRPA